MTLSITIILDCAEVCKAKPADKISSKIFFIIFYLECFMDEFLLRVETNNYLLITNRE